MKLTVLGNNGPYPAAGAACSGYLLSSDSGNTNIIIDFGTGCLANIPHHIAYGKIDAILLSHLHFDHMSDMLPMQYALQFNPPTKPIPVYSPSEPTTVYQTLLCAAYENHPMTDCEIGEMKIHVIPSRHPVPTFAIRIECDSHSFGYTGDSNTLDTLPDFFDGCDLLLADAGLSIEHWSEKAPHFSAAECGRLAQLAHVGSLLLTHLNPRYTPEQLTTEAQMYFSKTEFTEIGKTYSV